MSDWVVTVDTVFPNQVNPLGTLFGGVVLQWMDINASVACVRFCRQASVTASTEPVDFRNPIYVGEIVEVKSRVAWTGRTSMIVRSEVHGENPITGERRLCTIGHLNFVAIGEDGRPTPVPTAPGGDRAGEASLGDRRARPPGHPAAARAQGGRRGRHGLRAAATAQERVDDVTLRPGPPLLWWIGRERSGAASRRGGSMTDVTPTRSNDALQQRAINAIRALVIDATQAAGDGHPGMPMGMAPVGYVLYRHAMKHNPSNPAWPDRDRYVQSAGHGSMLQYSLLHLTGYDLPMAELERYRQWGSKTPGHPEYGHTPGVETTTGPLGQGISTAVGMALAEAHLAARFNRPGFEVIDHHTYVIASDGDLMEGVSGEASSFAGHLGLGKLIVLYDDNGISIDGSTDITFTEDVQERYRAYGWHVQSVDDANDVAALQAAVAEARREALRPSFIAVRSVIGFGAPHKQGTSAVHGSILGDEEAAAAKRNLAIDWAPFTVPDDVAEHYRSARGGGAARRAGVGGAHGALPRGAPRPRRRTRADPVR